MTDKELRRIHHIKGQATIVLARSSALKIEADNHYNNIKAFMAKYPMSLIEKMDWLEREKVMGEADVLFEQLKQTEEAVAALDVEYQALRIEVNKIFGREVMPDITLPKIISEDHDDPADWWKK